MLIKISITMFVIGLLLGLISGQFTSPGAEVKNLADWMLVTSGLLIVLAVVSGAAAFLLYVWRY